MKNKIRIHRCSRCNKDATYYYMPSSNGRRYYCEDCVPRGCFCNTLSVEIDGEPSGDNFVWVDKNVGEYEYTDEKGRREPCCEYDYEEKGQAFFNTLKCINVKDVVEIYKKVFGPEFSNMWLDAFIKVTERSSEEKLDYNLFMSHIRYLCKSCLKKYTYFKEECRKVSFNEYEYPEIIQIKV